VLAKGGEHPSVWGSYIPYIFNYDQNGSKLGPHVHIDPDDSKIILKNVFFLQCTLYKESIIDSASLLGYSDYDFLKKIRGVHGYLGVQINSNYTFL
jgi:hypothetical protein